MLGVLAAVAVVWLLGRLSDDGIFALQSAALALGLALATILDDPSAEIAAATPTPLRVRRAVTIALGGAVVAVAWIVLTTLSTVGASWTAAVTIELIAVAFVTLALAATLARGGSVAGPAIAIGFLTVRAVKPTWTTPDDTGDVHWILAWAAVTVGAVLALALASRDRAHRSLNALR